jgi:hypothetical protein
MPLLWPERLPAPTALLADLRRSRTTSAPQCKQILDAWDLRPLSGGRNNEVHSWAGPDGPLCIKIYQLDERQRAPREWHALTLLAQHSADYAPAPLWIDETSEWPIIGMTLLPGSPLPDAKDMPRALKALAETTRALQEIPLSGGANRLRPALHHPPETDLACPTRRAPRRPAHR